MSSRFSLTIPQGLVHEHPDKFVDAVAGIVESEGGDREDWLDRVAKAAGAERTSVPVSQRPMYAVITEAIEESEGIYETAMTLAMSEIRTLLESAFDEIDREAIRERVRVDGE